MLHYRHKLQRWICDRQRRNALRSIWLSAQAQFDTWRADQCSSQMQKRNWKAGITGWEHLLQSTKAQCIWSPFHLQKQKWVFFSRLWMPSMLRTALWRIAFLGNVRLVCRLARAAKSGLLSNHKRRERNIPSFAQKGGDYFLPKALSGDIRV